MTKYHEKLHTTVQQGVKFMDFGDKVIAIIALSVYIPLLVWMIKNSLKLYIKTILLFAVIIAAGLILIYFLKPILYPICGILNIPFSLAVIAISAIVTAAAAVISKGWFEE